MARTKPDATLEDARQIWISKRGQSDFPGRSAFSLRDLRRVIHHLAFVAIEGATASHRNYRIKFMGDGLTGMMGNHAGHLLADAFVPPRAEKLGRHFAEVERARTAMIFSGSMAEGGDEHFVHHTLIAPLADDGISIDSFMVVILFSPAQ